MILIIINLSREDIKGRYLLYINIII